MTWVQLGICAVVCGYFCLSAYKLMNGKGSSVSIPGFSILTSEDQAYYDMEKLYKYAAYMNIACALGVAVIGISAFENGVRLMFAGLIIIAASMGAFRYALMRTPFFIKKQ